MKQLYLSLLIFIICSFSAFSQTADLYNIKVDENSFNSDETGFYFTSSFIIEGLKNTKTFYSICIYDENGKALYCDNDKYKTESNILAVEIPLMPQYESSRWNDITRFFPYHLFPKKKGSSKYMLAAYLSYYNNAQKKWITLDKTSTISFTINVDKVGKYSSVFDKTSLKDAFSWHEVYYYDRDSIATSVEKNVYRMEVLPSNNSFTIHKSGYLQSCGTIDTIDKECFAKNKYKELFKYHSNGKMSYVECMTDTSTYIYELDVNENILSYRQYDLEGKLHGTTKLRIKNAGMLYFQHNHGVLNQTYSYYVKDTENEDGYWSYYNTMTHEQILKEEPREISENEYKNLKSGTTLYYDSNGTKVKCKLSTNSTLKKYLGIDFELENHTLYPIFINVDSISAYGYKKGQYTELEIMSCEEFVSKIRKKQARQNFWMSFASSLAASLGANSTYTTTTSIDGKTYTSYTTIHDYGKEMELLNSYNDTQNKKLKDDVKYLKSISEGYLFSQPIECEENVNGTLYIKSDSYDYYKVLVTFNGIKYPFIFKNIVN